MPRIIDVDTEAFAPTHQKTYQEPREAAIDTRLRRIGTKMGLVQQALPLASMGVSALDEYLVTPIQQKLKGMREGEYKESKAGEALLEGGETPMQKIARERLAAQEKTAGMYEPAGMERAGRREAETAVMPTPTERAATWLQEAREEVGEEPGKMPGATQWEAPVTRGKMTPGEEGYYKSKGKVVTPEYSEAGRRLTKPGQTMAVSPEMKKAIKLGRREDEDQEAARLGTEFAMTQKAPLPRGAAGVAEYELPELDVQKIAAERLRDQIAQNEERVRSPIGRKMGRERIETEAIAAMPEEERMFRMPPTSAPSTEMAPAATPETTPAGRMPPHPWESGIEKPAPYQPRSAELQRSLLAPMDQGDRDAQTKRTLEIAKEVLAARKGAEPGFAGAEAPAAETQTAQMAKAAEEPVKPKTLATASDDELASVGRRLQKLVQENPNDPEFANRLRQVELEQRHREEKMEYEEWAPMARAANTPEEQQRVLEMAKRVRMPVEGIAGLLKSPSERAKEKALGTREEKGLFPEMERPTTEWDIALKKAKIVSEQGKAQGLSDKQATERAKAWVLLNRGDLAAEQAESVAAKREPEVINIQEAGRLKHMQERLAEAKAAEIEALLPVKTQKYQADIARLRGLAARTRAAGGGGRGINNEDWKWANLWLSQQDRAVDNARAAVTQSKNEAGSLLRDARKAEIAATSRAEDVAEYEAMAKKVPPMDPKYAEIQAKLVEKKAEARAALAAKNLAKETADAAATAAQAAQDKLDASLKESAEGMGNVRDLFTVSPSGEKVRTLRAEPKAAPAAAPAAPAAAPARPAQKERKAKDGRTMYQGADGKWYYKE